MKEDKAKKRSDDTLREGVDYNARLLYASFQLRIFHILAGLLAISIIKYVLNIGVPPRVLPILYLWLFTDFLYLLPFRPGVCKTRRLMDNIHFSYYFLGVTYATALVHYLGGAEWIAFFLYFFDLIYANVLMRRARGAAVTFFIIACYFGVIFLEYYGVLPREQIFLPTMAVYESPRYILGTNVVIVGLFFFLISYGTGLFSRMKEEREKRVIESKNRFAAKSEQLEEMARVLRKNAAENVYIKRAAMGYIEKKEYELETTKKDLESQIDKLRKTQRSMFFMIEDLNEMSMQLKDARDHLEDKVRERTDELRDISRKLYRSERLAFIGKLAGGITHELRNSLAVLKNAAYLLERKVKDKGDKKMMKDIGMVDKEIKHIDSIIDDIMGFARSRPPVLELSDANTMIESAVSAISVPDLVRVEKELGKVPLVNIDANQIMHAVMNLAENAIVAMNGNGTLTFRTFEDEGWVCIEVEDTGPGIPAEDRNLIFEPLFTSKPKGTGLGLPISKMMVESQGGMIGFRSEAGRGTVFRISLPVGKG